ncbi:MAG: hypothetical protein IPJ19_19025 [Planctomycetes bacterium]|nr:hypothetical protein [Planctomycetota bacterium]
MPLACCIDRGPKELTHLGARFPMVDVKKAVLIGVRTLDEQEKEEIRTPGIHVFTLRDIDVQHPRGDAHRDGDRLPPGRRLPPDLRPRRHRSLSRARSPHAASLAGRRCANHDHGARGRVRKTARPGNDRDQPDPRQPERDGARRDRLGLSALGRPCSERPRVLEFPAIAEEEPTPAHGPRGPRPARATWSSSDGLLLVGDLPDRQPGRVHVRPSASCSTRGEPKQAKEESALLMLAGIIVSRPS